MKGFFYSILLDPLLKGLRDEVIKQAGKPQKVIDVACGPGTLSIAIAKNAGHVTGIDLDEDLISFASGRTGRKKIKNVRFEVLDASNLSKYSNREFDIAVTSMAVHQFEPLLAVKILSEMKRIASGIIIADYNCPMPDGISRSFAYGIESMTPANHYHNFLNYMSKGGLKYFTFAAGLSVKSTSIRSNGVVIVAVCE